jgi:Glyoxalase-like domain
MPSIDALEIADEPAAWSALGFHVEDARCHVSRVTLHLAGKGARRGITGWTLGENASGGAGAGAVASGETAAAHPNGVVRVDHVVMLSPELDRTVAELEAQGFDLRRTREGPTPGGSTRQAFFRAGEPILEVVQAPEGSSVARDADGAARLWGLAFLVEDLDRTADALGDRLGAPRDAVQPGRRIATLRGEAALGPAVAFMSPGPGALG